MKLSELPRRTVATVASVDDQAANDPIARRLRELGFVPGEQVEVMAVGPIATEPMLVQVGFTRFALRRREAARVTVRVGEVEMVVPGQASVVEVEAAHPPRLEHADAANLAGEAGTSGGARDAADPDPRMGANPVRVDSPARASA